MNEWFEEESFWIATYSTLFTEERFEAAEEEVEKIVSLTGFQNIRRFGNLDGTEYGLDARRLIAVADKGD